MADPTTDLKRARVERFASMISAPEDPKDAIRANNELSRNSPYEFVYWLDPRFTSMSDLDKKASRTFMVKLHPSYARTRADDPRMEKFIEWCEQNNKPLLVHCGRWNEYANYKFAIEAAKKTKGLIILAHMGGPAYDLKTRALEEIEASGLSNIAVDTSTCFTPYLIEKAVRILGSRRIYFASDSPLYHPTPTRTNIDLANVSQCDAIDILDGNYERLML